MPATEELVVLSVETAADVGEFGFEFGLVNPTDLVEARFDLVAQPQRHCAAEGERLAVRVIGEHRQFAAQVLDKVSVAVDVFAGLGAFMADAAAHFDPSAAKGIDATLRSFAHAPLGPWLLAIVATGLGLYGAYSLCEARWHRTV
jgi:hypothetical protein